jgi:hypothetical protein
MERLGFFSEMLIINMARQGITAKVLSDHVDYSYEHVRKLTRNEVLPSPVLLHKLCEVFRWKERQVAKFVRSDHARKKFGKYYWERLGLNAEYEEFYILWVFLSEEEKRFVYDLLRFYVERKEMREPV